MGNEINWVDVWELIFTGLLGFGMLYLNSEAKKTEKRFESMLNREDVDLQDVYFYFNKMAIISRSYRMLKMQYIDIINGEWEKKIDERIDYEINNIIKISNEVGGMIGVVDDVLQTFGSGELKEVYEIVLELAKLVESTGHLLRELQEELEAIPIEKSEEILDKRKEEFIEKLNYIGAEKKLMDNKRREARIKLKEKLDSML